MTPSDLLPASERLAAIELTAALIPTFDPEVRPGVFRRIARDFLGLIAHHPNLVVPAMGALLCAAMRGGLKSDEYLEAMRDAVAETGLRFAWEAPAVLPTPDTAPDTVVTSSPAVVGVDLAQGPDATSVVVCDNEVS